MSDTITAAGSRKQEPATISPRQPRFSWPMKIVVSVELGPGIKLAAASRSRNSACVIQRRRRTKRNRAQLQKRQGEFPQRSVADFRGLSHCPCGADTLVRELSAEAEH